MSDLDELAKAAREAPASRPRDVTQTSWSNRPSLGPAGDFKRLVRESLGLWMFAALCMAIMALTWLFL